MEMVKSGNIDYMTEIFNRYNNQIFKYFFRLSGSPEDSQDLTQSVFLRMLKYRKSFNPSKSFKIWIYSISKNTFNTHYQSKPNIISFPETLNQLENGDCTNDDKVLKLHQSINRLPDEYKELIVLSKYQGLKYKEIAEMFHSTEASIKNKVFRAFDKLRKIYFNTD